MILKQILIVLILLIIIYLLHFKIYINEIKSATFSEYTKYPLVKSSKIPNIIYTYWHDENIPIFVSKCINSWKEHNPTYQIVILNKNNINQFIPFDVYKLKFAKTHQQIADFIRIYILADRGGIWLDSTIYLNESLDWIHSYQVNKNSEFVGYKIDGIVYYFGKLISPVVENWFLACIPKSQFMKDWKDMFFSINNYLTIDDYVDFIKIHTDLKGILFSLHNYLTMHIACQYILQNSKYKNDYKLSLLEAEKGPFLYLNKINWNYIFLVPILIHFKGKESPIIKYTGVERNIITKLRLYNLYK